MHLLDTYFMQLNAMYLVLILLNISTHITLPITIEEYFVNHPILAHKLVKLVETKRRHQV